MMPNLQRIIPTVHPATGRKGMSFVFYNPAGDTENGYVTIHVFVPRN